MHIIDKKLQEIACPVSSFAMITGGLIGRTRLTQALQGEKPLDHNLLEKLVALLDEMLELKRSSFIAPDWSDHENIRMRLEDRRAFKLAVKYDADDMRELVESNGASGAK